MSTPPITKHLEAVARRESCRASLLELRRVARQKETEALALENEAQSLRKLEARERSRLIELTREVTQLLDADLSGLVPRERGPEVEVAPGVV